MPGFPFAAPVAVGGMSSPHLAVAVAAAMAQLGYDRYVVSAGGHFTAWEQPARDAAGVRTAVALADR